MFKLFVLAGLMLAVSSCGRATQPLAPSAVGEYLLTTIDARALPTAGASGDSVIVGGAVLDASGSYVISWLEPSYYFGTRSVIAVQDSGSWGANGSTIEFSARNGASFGGTFTAPTLLVHYRSDNWAFAKQ